MKNIGKNTEKKILYLILKLTLILLFGNIGFIQAQAPNIEWQKSFGGSLNEGAFHIKQTIDGGYIMAGESNSNNGDVTGNNGSYDSWIVKTDATGVLVWQNSLGGPGEDYSRGISETSDGGYIAVGKAEGNGGDVTGNHGANDIWVVKLNAAGDLQWQKSLGGSATDNGNSIIQATDGNYVVAGSTASNDGNVNSNHGGSDFWLVKLDTNGDIIWEKTYGGSLNEEAHSLQQTSNGGFIVTGSASSFDGDVTVNQGEADYWVINLDGSGNLLWEKSFGGSEYDIAFSVIQTTDGGYIVSGYTLSNDGDVSENNGETDVWVIKLSPSGNLEWERSLGGSDPDLSREILEIPGHGYIVIGHTESNNGNVSGNHGSYDVWVARLNAEGILQWQKCMGGTDLDFGRSIQSTNDGGFVIAGYSASNDGDVTVNHGGGDFWMIKLAPETLGIDEFDENKIVLYPNPVIENLQIEASESIEKIIVFNLQGQKLFEQSPNTFNAEISMESYSEGTYLLQIISDKQTATYKIIKN